MYIVEFYDKNENHYKVMTLEIHGDTRTEVLRTIMEEQWEQYGDFFIEEEDAAMAITDLVAILCGVEIIDDISWLEAEYRLMMHAELNLDLTVVLSSARKNIGPEGIIDIFCNAVKESWEFNETLDIVYEIKKV